MCGLIERFAASGTGDNRYSSPKPEVIMSEVRAATIPSPGINETRQAPHVIETDVSFGERLETGLCSSIRLTQPGKVKARLSSWQARSAIKLLMDNLDRSITIATVAKECSLSRSHFSRAFRNTTGHSPRDWLQTARLARAKELLELTDFSVSHVGFECGFADQPHFTRTFAKKVGMTPAKWRLENRPRQ